MYPGIRVDLFTESGRQLREALKNGRIDLLLLPDDGNEPGSGITYQKIYTEELVLCAGKDTLPTGNWLTDPSLLDQQPFFVLRPEYAVRNFCDAYFAKNRIRPVIRNELSSSITCYRMAAAGLGFAIVPFMTTQLAAPDHGVTLYSLAETPITWDVNMYYRKEAYLGQPEQDMIRLACHMFDREYLPRIPTQQNAATITTQEEMI